LRISVSHSRSRAPDALGYLVGTVSTPRVLLALAVLAGCASGSAHGQDTRVGSSEMAQAPGPMREAESPTGQRSRAGWAFGVRDDQKAEAVWVGAWTTASCQELLTGFVARGRFPSRQFSECRPLAFTAGPSGRQMWAVTSDSWFVASAAEATCNQTMARIMPNQEHPSCALVWVTFP
jgi:hypothetical protein